MIRFIKQNYDWLTLTLICVLGLALYSNILHSPFQFDDENFIVNNLGIRQLSNFSTLSSVANTRFIIYLSFALNYHFHQLHVFGYHLFNLSVHLITAILVWLLLRITLTTPQLYSQKISSYAKAISFFAGIIFLVHPIQTEGVTYIYQRSASLATLFYLASLILYLKYRLLNLSGKGLKHWCLYYSCSLIIAALAMFTKETAFTLPFMIILYELCFFEKRSGADWMRIIIFLLSLAIIPVTIMFNLRSADLAAIHQVLEKNARSSSWNYLLTQFRVIVTYIRLVFLPINQNLDYDYPIAKSLFALPVLSCICLLLAIQVSALRILHKYRLLSFGIFWFFLTLIPESSIIPITDVIFEHRLYLPMVGYSIFLVSLIYYFFSFKKGKFAIILLTSIALVYAIATYARNQVWQDKLTLWNDAVEKSPQKARVYNNRGLAYYRLERLKEAIADYSKAIEIDQNYSQAYSNRGLAYYDKGDLDNAILDHSKALKLNPKLAEAHSNRGLAYYDKGELEKALLDYAMAIDINPYYFQAFSNIGNIYRSVGNIKQAIICYDRAIQINPMYAEAFYNRGIAYYNQGQFNEAITDYAKALNIKPELSQAYNNRGLAYYKNGDKEQAFSDWNKAILINPKLAGAYNNRGVAYFFSQNYERAWEDFHRASTLGYRVQENILKDLKRILKKKD